MTRPYGAVAKSLPARPALAKEMLRAEGILGCLTTSLRRQVPGGSFTRRLSFWWAQLIFYTPSRRRMRYRRYSYVVTRPSSEVPLSTTSMSAESITAVCVCVRLLRREHTGQYHPGERVVLTQSSSHSFANRTRCSGKAGPVWRGRDPDALMSRGRKSTWMIFSIGRCQKRVA